MQQPPFLHPEPGGASLIGGDDFSWEEILSFNSATWEMMPTSRPPFWSSSRALMALSRVSGSRDPNPSSTRMVSRCRPPA